MKLNEAYQKLECQESISDEDLKKTWRSLAKKYHPDVYSEDPNKLKEINEAYQLVKDYRENPQKYQNQGQQGNPFNINFSEIFSNFAGFGNQQPQQQRRNVQHIFLKTEISFEESVTGVDKEFEINKDVKCEPCNGQGFIQKKNDCKFCDGYGQSSVRHGNSIFSSSCSKCHGKGSRQDCDVCKKKTYSNTKINMSVKIPAGVRDTNTVQLQGAGNFAGVSAFGDACSNVLITISVKNNTPLRLEENDVVYDLDISLLEALEGCSKLIPTIKGEQEIKIPIGIRNKEEVIIPNLGLRLMGNQRVVMNVVYPVNKEKLIETLRNDQYISK